MVRGTAGERERRSGARFRAGVSGTYRRTFRSFRRRNFRLYYAGLLVSNIGTWLQAVAQAWLVLELTGDGTALGIVTALQFLPILLFGAWGGLLADRFDKRRLILATQSLAAVQALVVGLAVVAGRASVPLVFGGALVLGLVNAVDNPARRSFIAELVDLDEVANAMGLNTAVMTTSRVIGPALAGVLIHAIGPGGCYLVNAVSFVAVLTGVLAIRRSELRTATRTVRGRGQVREGFVYAWRTPSLRLALGMTAVMATLAFNYSVSLPLLVARVFDGGPGMFGALLSVTSIGSMVGALLTASRLTATRGYLIGTAAVFGVAMCGLALSPWLWLAFICAIPMGGAGSAFVSAGGAMLQAGARPDLRGRVMALHAVVFQGSTPIGGPIVGAIGEHAGARWGLLVGGLTSIATVVTVFAAGRRSRTPGRATRKDLAVGPSAH